MKATVYKSTGSWYVVKTQDQVVYQARIKGVFKIDGISSTNPVAVGDIVDIDVDNDHEASAIITDIAERHNYIARNSPHQNKRHHIIAANLDQCLLFATLKEPRTSTGFIDRFLVTAEAYHIPSIIVFNKADIYKPADLAKYQHLCEIYQSIGYTVFLASMIETTGYEGIVAALGGKTTLLCGHSGVGKSSFLNLLVPDLEARTAEVSKWSGKGMHTTTFAEMFDVPDLSARVIDTPGIKEFGIIDISKAELSHYFPEMRDRLNDCQFNNCLHVNEPGCAIKEAVIAGEIAEERFLSYCGILDTIDDKKY